MSLFFQEFFSAFINEQSKVIRGRSFLTERKELSMDGLEDLLSVSEYSGVTKRKDNIEDGEFISRADTLEGYRIVRKNDLVMNYMLAWKGALGVSDIEGITSPAYSVFSIDSNYAEPRFIHALFRTKLFSAYFRTESTGIIESRLRLYPEALMSLKMVLPPVDKQRIIVEFIDRETTLIDSLIEKKTRFIELLKEKRQALITQAVTKGLDPNVKMKDSGVEWLGQVPEHWEVCRLRRLLSDSTYGISEPLSDEGAISVLRMGDIKDGEIDTNSLGFVEKVDEALLLHKGDLVFNRTNSLDKVGKVGLVREEPIVPLSYASYLVRFRTKPKITSKFLHFVLNSNYGQAFSRSEAIPAIGQANLNPDKYSYIFISVPTLEEQEIIIIHLERIIEGIELLITKNKRSIDLLKERRSALITAAVTGKIGMREAIL